MAENQETGLWMQNKISIVTIIISIMRSLYLPGTEADNKNVTEQRDELRKELKNLSK